VASHILRMLSCKWYFVITVCQEDVLKNSIIDMESEGLFFAGGVLLTFGVTGEAMYV
jgi:hypothetical protein